jgi:predicted alpha/beta-fold hydrolase
VAQAVALLHARFPASPLFLAGFSLGANLMVKHLGEQGHAAVGVVTAAVSVRLMLMMMMMMMYDIIIIIIIIYDGQHHKHDQADGGRRKGRFVGRSES